MEDSFQNTLWLLRIHSYALWSNKCPASFQHFIHDTLREFLDIFCTAYLDDILIYSDILEEHKQHVRKVLQKLKDAKMFLSPEKCEFQIQRTQYHGLIITPGGFEMDPKKIGTVVK